jgi:hypothetical protein
MACHGCWKAAKAHHLATIKERHAFRKECREPAARAPQKGLISWLVVAAPRGTTPRRSR